MLVRIDDRTGNKDIHCARCGGCCKDITPSVEDLLRLEEYKLEEILDFEKNDLFFRNVDSKCIFLRDNLCSIYDKRPDICKLYPFKVEPSNVAENEIIFKLTCRSNIRNGGEYPLCNGGLIGKAYFVEGGDNLSVAESYAKNLLREFASNSLVKVDNKLTIAKDLDEIKSYKLDYLNKIFKIYRNMSMGDAMEILKRKYGKELLNSLQDWFQIGYIFEFG
ncbi:MAG: YkgJ family cysteine cluster protein [Candidatus Aenigmarchaeota archaeon]|nr:YkgJ family cysteine cluster protein [Candidatus Aenigmarchaeota archaeon]